MVSYFALLMKNDVDLLCEAGKWARWSLLLQRTRFPCYVRQRNLLLTVSPNGLSLDGYQNIIESMFVYKTFHISVGKSNSWDKKKTYAGFLLRQGKLSPVVLPLVVLFMRFF